MKDRAQHIHDKNICLIGSYMRPLTVDKGGKKRKPRADQRVDKREKPSVGSAVKKAGKLKNFGLGKIEKLKAE